MNSIGTLLRLTTFGESHGPALGGIIDGFPSNIRIDFKQIDRYMARRRPGTSSSVSARKEVDAVNFLSGITEEGITIGTPIGFEIPNTDAKSSDYYSIKDTYRPNHADYTYDAKYGIRDYRGGGRASARTTAPWVCAGAMAIQLLALKGISVEAKLTSIGGIEDATQFKKVISKAKRNGDSVGGIVECTIKNLPAGIGEPCFDKLQARLAHAMMSINGVKGFEYGDGFEAAAMCGSEHNDAFIFDKNEGRIRTMTNHSGGIQGGISNGEDIVFRVAFKPTPSIGLPMLSVDNEGHKVIMCTDGRHDPCIALRGTVIVEALAAFVVADAMMVAGYSFNRSE